MTHAIRLERVIEKDGELYLKGLPYKKGESVEMILLATPKRKRRKRSMTAKELSRSEIVGMWKDRSDIPDSSSLARQLRDRAQRREA